MSARSTFRRLALTTLVLAALAPTQALARNGGIYLELAPAWGFFLTDEVIVEDGDDGGVDCVSASKDRECFPQAGFTPTVKLGFNILGVAGAELDVAAHGWDIGNVERGGAGYVGGVFRVTPLEVISLFAPPDLEMPSFIPPGPVTWRHRPFDIGIYMGGGYHIVGEDYAYQGGYFHWGFDAKWYITPNFAVGIDVPFRNAIYEPFRYVDYADSNGFCTDGGDAFGIGGVPVVPNPNREVFFPVEVNSSNAESACAGGSPPTGVLFSPSLTIAGVFDFGI